MDRLRRGNNLLLLITIFFFTLECKILNINFVLLDKSKRQAATKRPLNELNSESEDNNSSGEDYRPNESDIVDDDSFDEISRGKEKRKKIDPASKHSSPKRADNSSKCMLNVEFRHFKWFRYTIFDTSRRKYFRYPMHAKNHNCWIALTLVI